MREIQSKEELEQLNQEHKQYIIEYGVPDTCIPCKLTKENLELFEKENRFDLEYFSCSDVNIISELGFTSIPVLQLVTKSNVVLLNDSSVSMDEEELNDWLKINIGE